MYSYLHNDSDDTHYSNRARPIRFDEFSAPRHGDVVIVRTFVLWVLGCKSLFDVGTIRKKGKIVKFPSLQRATTLCCPRLSRPTFFVAAHFFLLLFLLLNFQSKNSPRSRFSYVFCTSSLPAYVISKLTSEVVTFEIPHLAFRTFFIPRF
jgi:hypothetical protein